jgi:hypothetical protein
VGEELSFIHLILPHKNDCTNMILKIFRAVWFVSVLGVLAHLLFVYASLGENVIIQEEATGQTVVGREFLFYVMMIMLVITNVLVYIIGKMYPKEENFRSWFHGLIISINIFFVVAMSLILTYNSGERFDFSRIVNIIYGSIALVVIWSVSWPLYSIFRRFFPKEAVS